MMEIIPRIVKSAWPILSYMAYALLYTAIQHFQLFERYKIAKSDPTSLDLIDASFRCFQLQCMHSLIEYYFGDETLYSEGSGVRLWRIFLGAIAIDTYQYFFHRMLHEMPWLYQHVHKDHHKYQEPFAFTGLYNSFVESLFVDAGCVIFATIACGLRAQESILLATLASAKTVQDHCGYSLPFDPLAYFPNNAEYHRHHHMPVESNPVAFQQPFFTFWDWIFGTYPFPAKQGRVIGREATTDVNWGNFKRIVCLNLRERPDRRQHAEKEFRNAGILERVSFHLGEKSPRGALYGSFQSHWEVIDKAYRDIIENILIFEDDVTFQQGWEEVVNDCNAFVVDEVDWEFLNVNGPIFYYIEESRSSTRIINGKSTKAHAVCLSRRGMERFLKLFPEPAAVGIDDVYTACFYRAYVHRNYTAIQQLEGLGTDHPWHFLQSTVGVEEHYKFFIQITYMPEICRLLSWVALAVAPLPWEVRPWLFANSYAENFNADIHVYRNGKQEKFPWKVSFCANLLVMMAGLLVAFKISLPKEINRWRLIVALLKI